MKSVLFALAALAAAGAFGSVPLRNATVVVPDGYYQGRFLRMDAAGAVLDLTNALAKVTGGSYRVLKESALGAADSIPVIFLGDTAAARAAGCADASLKNCEAKVVTTGNRVFIWSKTAWGVSRGVIEFLRRSIDYWYLTLSEKDPYVVNPAATAPDGKYVVHSWLQDHTVYHGMFSYSRYPETKEKWVDFSRRLGIYHCGGTDPKYALSSRVPQGHSTFAYLSPETYFKEHPEYFALRDEGGKLHRSAARNAGGQICYTHPETRRICYESLRAFVKADREELGKAAPHIYDFSQQDYSCGKLCLCEACLKTAAKYDRDGGYRNGGCAGLQLDLVNEMARKIRKEFPEVHIRTFAYAATEVRPVNIEPEENVIIWLCDYVNTDAMYPLTAPVNAARLAYMDSWGLKAKRLHIWDYFIYGWRDDVDYPMLYVDAIAADARHFRNYPLEYLFWESEYHNRAFHELNYFVAAEVLRDPDADVGRLVHVYCRVYGKAAKRMERAINSLRKLIRENPPAKVGERPWLTVANMEKLRDFLLGAYAEADTPEAKARVAKVIASCEFYLADECQKRGCLDAAAVSREAFKRFEKEHTALCVMETKDRREQIEKLIDERADVASLRFKNLPKELETIPPGDLVCLDHRAIGGPKKPDPAAEKGHAGEWGFGRGAASFKGFPIDCGIYDPEDKAVGRHYKLNLPDGATKLPAGGAKAYRWYKAGVGTIGRKTILHFMDWTVDFKLARLWQDPEAGENLNTFEIWVSLRADGPAYVEGSKGENRLYIDRVALRRVREGK